MYNDVLAISRPVIRFVRLQNLYGKENKKLSRRPTARMEALIMSGFDFALPTASLRDSFLLWLVRRALPSTDGAGKASGIATVRTKQHFCLVRVDNLFSSNGSVISLLKRHTANIGPIPFTDRTMALHFMWVKDVAAGSLPQRRRYLSARQGVPVLAAGLAKNAVRISGFKFRSPKKRRCDIEIVVTGKRPGKKLFQKHFYDETTAAGLSVRNHSIYQLCLTVL